MVRFLVHELIMLVFSGFRSCTSIASLILLVLQLVIRESYLPRGLGVDWAITALGVVIVILTLIQILLTEIMQLFAIWHSVLQIEILAIERRRLLDIVLNLIKHPNIVGDLLNSSHLV